MLRTTPYFTTAPVTGLLPQLFDSSIKSAIESGARVCAAVDYLLNSQNGVAPPAVLGSQVIAIVRSIADNPPVFTVYQVGRGGQGTSKFVSPFAPLFNVVV